MARLATLAELTTTAHLAILVEMTTTAGLPTPTRTELEASPAAASAAGVAITAPGTPELRTIPPGTNPVVGTTTALAPLGLPLGMVVVVMMIIRAEPKKVL